jgi:putative transposase
VTCWNSIVEINFSVHEGSHATMKKDTVVPLRQPEGQDLLSTMLREGAQRLIAEALQAEFDEYLGQFAERRDDEGRLAVVRNGWQPRREVLTGLGPVGVRVPKARSRIEEPAVFRSVLVPPYVRRAKAVDAALPWLYLHGVSTGDMREALAALVGPEAKGLSPPVVARLKQRWSQEYKAWRRKPLGKDRWVYVWADGIYCGLRAEDQRLCALVLIGVNERGQKRFLAIEDGVRESKQSWLELLRDLKERGLKLAPNLAVGDGALGFWAGLEEIFPATRHQRCWVHKTANVLNYLPKSLQARAKAGLHDIWMAETKANAETAFDRFVTNYGAKYPKTTECISGSHCLKL